MNNLIQITKDTQLKLEAMDLLTANEDFYHVDRIAPFHVLIYCINGCIHVGESDGERSTDYDVKPGELLILKQGLHQYPTQKIGAGTTWIYAHFYTIESDSSPLEQQDNDSKKDGLIFELDEMKQEKHKVCIPKKLEGLKRTELEDSLYRLVKTVSSTSELKTYISPIELHRLLLNTVEYSMDRKSPDLCDEIIRYLYGEANRHLTCEDMEKHFHLSYKYMEHVFKKKNGYPIMFFHTRLRIKKSAETLRATNLSIAAIGEMYGYNDQLYFSRCFKKHMGISPKQYRQQQH